MIFLLFIWRWRKKECRCRKTQS